MSRSPDWLSRYLGGPRDQVWQEMRQLGSTVHEHSNGGFPWPTTSQDQWRIKQALAKDLLPL